MQNKQVKILIVVVIVLSLISVGLGGYIVYDKLLEDKTICDGNKVNDNNDVLDKDENKKETGNTDDEFKRLEQAFIKIVNDEQNNNTSYEYLDKYYEDKCKEEIQGNFCIGFDIGNNSNAIYFIYNDSLYFGDSKTKKLHFITGLDGVPIKVIYATYSSDTSIPVVAVLTRNGIGYLASTNTDQEHDVIVNKITDLKKIESEEKLADIIFLQNYEVFDYEVGVAGSAIPFVKYASGGYTWNLVIEENQNEKKTYKIGPWLQSKEDVSKAYHNQFN